MQLVRTFSFFFVFIHALTFGLETFPVEEPSNNVLDVRVAQFLSTSTVLSYILYFLTKFESNAVVASPRNFSSDANILKQSSSGYHQGFRLQSKMETPMDEVKCLEIPQATMDLVSSDIWDCMDLDHYKFNFRFTGENFQDSSRSASIFQIIARHSGKCLDVYYEDTVDNTGVVQWDCKEKTAKNQRWYIRWLKNDVSSGYFAIVNELSGKCLTVNEGKPINGQGVNIYTCQDGDNQLWEFVPPA